MLPFLRNRRSLYIWALAGLTEVAVTIPWLLFCYSALDSRNLPETLPGIWLPMLVFAAAGAWEAGDRGDQARAGARRATAMVVGLVAAYGAAYLTMPARFQTGLLSMNVAWAMVPVAGYLWYQGTATVAGGVSYSRLFDRYGRQVATSVIGILLAIATGAASDPRVMVLLWWGVLLLFGAGLTALIVAREADLRKGQARTGDLAEAGSRQSPVVTGVILTLLVLTLASSQILGAERLAAGADSILNAVVASWEWLVKVIMLLVWRWALILGLVVEPFIKWLYRQLAKMPPPQEQEVEMGDGDPPLDEHVPLIPTDVLMPYVKAALLIAIVVGLAIWVYRLNSKIRQKALSDEEERESLGFWANLLGDLKSMLQRPDSPAAAVAEAEEALSPSDPRMLFRRLQVWGAVAAGRPRRPDETPNGYREALASRQPRQGSLVERVTAVYNQARYGGAPPDADRVRQAAEAIASLEREPREPATRP